MSDIRYIVRKLNAVQWHCLLLICFIGISSANRLDAELEVHPPKTSGNVDDVHAEEDEKLNKIRAMNPVGYWPAADDTGDVLKDESGRGLDGKIYNTAWRDGYLNFTGGYQWCEVLPDERFGSDDMSMGGWFFSRAQDYQREGAMLMGLGVYKYLRGNAPVVINAKQGLGLEVSHYRKIKLTDKKAKMKQNTWHHIFYSIKNGVKTLYLDGEPVMTNSDRYERKKVPLLVGNCGDWWQLFPATSNSLDGTFRSLILFDRGIQPGELKEIIACTQPQITPWTSDKNPFVIEGVKYERGEVMDMSYDFKHKVLLEILKSYKRDLPGLRAVVAQELSFLENCLSHWKTRTLAIKVLRKSFNVSNPVFVKHIDEWIETLKNSEASDEERASCVLALNEIKPRNKRSEFAEALKMAFISSEDSSSPKVENVLQNAIFLALLSGKGIDDANKVLDHQLAKPILDRLELTEEDTKAIEGNYANKEYFKALESLVSSKKGSDRLFYFSQGDFHRDDPTLRGNARVYTPKATSGNYTLVLGAGNSFNGCEPISPMDFERCVANVSKDFPNARKWRPSSHPHLYRVKIHQSFKDGRVKNVYLGGENFVFDGRDVKIKGWSVAIDSDGYIHIIGGQHNSPNYRNFLPGSWEYFGIPKDVKNENYPSQLYFVSKKPHEIGEFEFVSSLSNPRRLPPRYFNYMYFTQDKQRNLYVSGRINITGKQSYGIYSYDTISRSWSSLGDSAHLIIDESEDHTPGWTEKLHHDLRGSYPRGPVEPSVVWSWQPNFYNFCRDNWLIKFDLNDRLHFFMPNRGLDENGRVVDDRLYAWSDDRGKTFHRADGSEVKLPLTVNPAPSHNSSERSPVNHFYWNVYQDLIYAIGLL